MKPTREQAFEHIRTIIRAVQRASDPFGAVAGAIRSRPPGFHHPAVLAIGKAAPRMYEGLVDAVPGRYESIMVVPDGIVALDWAIRADHPVPTRRSLLAAQKLTDFVMSIASGDRHDGFITLISGGASSLVSSPLPGIDFDRYAAAIAELLKRGVDIHTLNTVRKHCEQLKGGRLAMLMRPLPCMNYILSDVIGDDLSTIASGPTVGDPTTIAEARAVFDGRFGYTDQLIPLRMQESPKPGDESFARIESTIVGSNQLAVQAAAAAAEGLGFHVTTVTQVTGEAAHAAARLVSQAKSAGAGSAVIFGGETTVNAGGSSGRGGRNQELALAAAIAIDADPTIVIASFATDGVDGPTDAAGAIVTGEVCRRASLAGLDPAAFLARHDSYSFFDALDRALDGALPGGHPHHTRTGPTGTNVNDIMIALVY